MAMVADSPELPAVCAELPLVLTTPCVKTPFALEEELLLGEEENSGEGIAGLESDEGDAE